MSTGVRRSLTLRLPEMLQGTAMRGAPDERSGRHHANATKHSEPRGPDSQCHRPDRWRGCRSMKVIRRSWNRCLTTYALDPVQSKRPNTVEHADLQARRQRIGAVLPIARIEMEGLSRLMLHSEYSIMLTDRDGVILSHVGDPGFAATARPLRIPRRRRVERTGTGHERHWGHA